MDSVTFVLSGQDARTHFCFVSGAVNRFVSTLDDMSGRHEGVFRNFDFPSNGSMTKIENITIFRTVQMLAPVTCWGTILWIHAVGVASYLADPAAACRVASHVMLHDDVRKTCSRWWIWGW